MLGFFYEPLMESSAEKKKVVLEELAPMYLRNLEKLVNDNGGYFVGGQVFFLSIYILIQIHFPTCQPMGVYFSQLTWVDIAYASLIDYLSHMAGKELVADKPALKALRNRVFELPAIKKYVETRVKYAY
jgi:glutathione S-transferase